ncbi:MAG: class II aldolase/adducin family protein [Gammaproteobacteria bacterium]
MSAPQNIELRRELCAGMCRLETLGLNRGTAGNMSARQPGGFLITPSGVKPGALAPAGIVALSDAGDVRTAGQRPSSEWRFHRDIYHARPDAHAIAHVHSAHATALACLRRPLPSFHYMVAVAGGADVRCAPYATFGSQALADGVITALDGRRACLMANHGMITLGADLAAAVDLAVEIEELARQYLLALAVGEPVILPPAEMDIVVEKFKTYGARHGDE